MVDTNVASLFNDDKLMNDPTIVVEVNLSCSKMVDCLAKVEMDEMFRVAGASGARLLADITADDIRNYLSTLGWLRRIEATHARSKATMPYLRFVRNVAVPTLWYQVLIGIGEALDRDYSIKFVPGTTIGSDELLDPGKLQAISDVMFQLQNNGFKVVAGVPKGAEGELDFMAMCHADEVVKSYRHSHPVYGFLASFFASHEVSTALGTLVRVTYGFDSDYRVALARIVAASGRGG